MDEGFRLYCLEREDRSEEHFEFHGIDHHLRRSSIGRLRHQYRSLRKQGVCAAGARRTIIEVMFAVWMVGTDESDPTWVAHRGR